MRHHRRRRGFEQAGTVPAAQLGLPARRARTLSLLQGWERVAGKTLSRHARASGVERGVLRIEAADSAWHLAVVPLLPQLVARLAIENPRLGIKKYRLDLAGTEGPAETRPVPEFAPRIDESDTRGERKAGDGTAPVRQERRDRPAPTARDLKRRLECVAHRYVERHRPQKA